MSEPSANPTSQSRHAIVIGGSIAGLLAAHVLLGHFDQVTLIERDRFPSRPESRKGVPQARHVHILLIRGQQILDQLFPGIRDELLAAGALTVDWAADAAVYGLAGWSVRFTSGMTITTSSRDLLEHTIRERVADQTHLRIVEECDVTGLLGEGSGATVRGVRLRPRRGHVAGVPEQEMRAEFVVDASGRDSHALDWLAALGYGQPEQTVINSFLGYASRWYRRPVAFSGNWKAMLITPRYPDLVRGGVIYPVERERWAVTLGGAGRDYPPTDEDGFLEFARSFASPALYEAIRAAEPLTPTYSYQRTENRWRHYERMRRWPDGFVALGDAVCAFNPVYGQGMTVAALGALALDEHLRAADGHLHGMARRFQKRLAQVVSTPWLMATGNDFRIPTTEGGSPRQFDRLIQHYIDRVAERAGTSPTVYRAFIEVAHLLAPPAALFRPAVVAQVLRRA